MGSTFSTIAPTIHPGQEAGSDVKGYGSDFAAEPEFSTNAFAAYFLVTAGDGGGTDKQFMSGGVIITPGTSPADYRSAQGQSVVSLAVSRTIEFFARIKSNDADDVMFAIGLATIDVAGTALGPVLDGVIDSIVFRNVLGNTATFLSVVEDDAVEVTGTGGTLVDDVYVNLYIKITGLNKAEFFVDGKKVAQYITGLPDAGAEMVPTFEVGSPTGTTASTLEISSWFVKMIDR